MNIMNRLLVTALIVSLSAASGIAVAQLIVSRLMVA
jgi:hypothetical protein